MATTGSPPEEPMQRGPAEMRDGNRERVEAVARRRQRVSAEGHAHRLLLGARDGRADKVRAGEDIAPARGGRPKGCGKLGPHREAPREMVEANEDITMPELARAPEDAAGVRAAPASLSRALRRWGFRVKERR
jgi:hypothetical protein